MKVVDGRPTDAGIIVERLAGLKEDLGRLEGSLGQLNENFDRSATKQGERIGELEKQHVEMRRDFHWSIRLAAALWALLQGAILVAMKAYLHA
jgi:hypothetical protein